MYDVWLKSLEDGELAGVCFLDMSAAFDIVDHPLLIKKLELYGFESSMVMWITSYLTDRSQCVSILQMSCQKSSTLILPAVKISQEPGLLIIWHVNLVAA